MRKHFCFLLLSVFIFSKPLSAQYRDSVPPGKEYYRYLGIQANLLVQQFISFNSNSSINTNPFVFSYVKSHAKTGKGFVFGTGFAANSSATNDGVSQVETQNVNVAFRLGVEQKYLQNERFIPFWGVELGFGAVYSKISSRLSQTFPTVGNTVETTRAFFGPAFRGGLNYALSKHIQIGTEFFFNMQIASTVTSRGFFSTSGSATPFNIGFQAPTALYLIFRY